MAVPPSVESLERLARVRALLPADDPDAMWFGSAMDRFMVGAEPSIDAALGLKTRGTPARTLEKMRRRDMLIREFAQTYCPRDATAADEISEKFDVYRTRSWLREAQVGQPVGVDPERAMIFAIFNLADGTVPQSPKQIARILRMRQPVPHRMSKTA